MGTNEDTQGLHVGKEERGVTNYILLDCLQLLDEIESVVYGWQ